MTRQIDAGRAIAIAGAAALFVSLFLTWYDPAGSGWAVFESLDLILAGIAIAIAALALGYAPETGRVAVIGLPIAATVIVAVQMLDGPPAAGGATPQLGAWLALAGALVASCGAILWQSQISVTVAVADRDSRPRAIAVDRRHDDEHAYDPGAQDDASRRFVRSTADEDASRTETFDPVEESR